MLEPPPFRTSLPIAYRGIADRGRKFPLRSALRRGDPSITLNGASLRLDLAFQPRRNRSARRSCRRQRKTRRPADPALAARGRYAATIWTPIAAPFHVRRRHAPTRPSLRLRFRCDANVLACCSPPSASDPRAVCPRSRCRADQATAVCEARPDVGASISRSPCVVAPSAFQRCPTRARFARRDSPRGCVRPSCAPSSGTSASMTSPPAGVCHGG